jgi:hypothetical protein
VVADASRLSSDYFGNTDVFSLLAKLIVMTIMTDPPDSTGVKRKTLLVLLIGITSSILYLLIYFAQRAIYLNGLSRIDPVLGIAVRGIPICALLLAAPTLPPRSVAL